MLEYLGILAVVLILIYTTQWFMKAQSFPPGPIPWPVIGNIRMFRKDPQGYKKFTELASKYGNVYRLVMTF